MKKSLLLGLVIILIAGLFSGCKDKKGDPPVLPPAESMLIDFSNFTSTAKSADLAFENKGTENLNWETAALIVGTWRTIIAVTLAIPVASFKVAVDQNPVYLSDNKWQWSYNVSAAGVAYKARLTGEIGDSIRWEMYVAREGTDPFAEFMWFKGTSSKEGSGGYWILSESHTVPTPILRINWTKSGTSVGTVKYIYLKSGSSLGAYIEYGLKSSSDFDAYFTIHYFNSSLARFSDVNIEWNTTSKKGRIRSSDYLDGQWQCWNETKVNVTCN